MLLQRVEGGSIFVPEVDWCSTALIRIPISTEKNHFLIQEKPNNPISVNFFFSFSNSIWNNLSSWNNCHRNYGSNILKEDCQRMKIKSWEGKTSELLHLPAGVFVYNPSWEWPTVTTTNLLEIWNNTLFVVVDLRLRIVKFI